VADVHAEALGDARDVDEIGSGSGEGQGLAPVVSVMFVHPPAKRVSATKCDKDANKDRAGSSDLRTIFCRV
jgi:hypothetical protein